MTQETNHLWGIANPSTASATSVALSELHNRDEEIKRRKGRTPFRLEIKFTPEEWRLFGERANAADASRYNFAKHLILGTQDKGGNNQSK